VSAKKPPIGRIEYGFLLVLLAMLSIAFALLLEPFLAAMVCAFVVAVLFAPINTRLLNLLPGRKNTVALLSLFLVIASIIVPAILLGAALVQEASGIYTRIQGGDINFGRVFVELLEQLPEWAQGQLEAYGLTDFQSIRDRLDATIVSSFEFLTTQVFSVGESALSFFLSLGVMLYLTYFFLRDGHHLANRVEQTIPLAPEQRRQLLEKFVGEIGRAAWRERVQTWVAGES